MAALKSYANTIWLLLVTILAGRASTSRPPTTRRCRPFLRPGSSSLKLYTNGMLAGAELRPFPNRALDIEHIVKEHNLDMAVAHHAFA